MTPLRLKISFLFGVERAILFVPATNAVQVPLLDTPYFTYPPNYKNPLNEITPEMKEVIRKHPFTRLSHSQRWFNNGKEVQATVVRISDAFHLVLDCDFKEFINCTYETFDE